MWLLAPFLLLPFSLQFFLANLSLLNVLLGSRAIVLAKHQHLVPWPVHLHSYSHCALYVVDFSYLDAVLAKGDSVVLRLDLNHVSRAPYLPLGLQDDVARANVPIRAGGEREGMAQSGSTKGMV